MGNQCTSCCNNPKNQNETEIVHNIKTQKNAKEINSPTNFNSMANTADCPPQTPNPQQQQKNQEEMNEQLNKLKQMQNNQEFKYRKQQDIEEFFSEISDILDDMDNPGKSNLTLKKNQSQETSKNLQSNRNITFDIHSVKEQTYKTSLNENDLQSELQKYEDQVNNNKSKKKQQNQDSKQIDNNQFSNSEYQKYIENLQNEESVERNSELDKCIDINNTENNNDNDYQSLKENSKLFDLNLQSL